MKLDKLTGRNQPEILGNLADIRIRRELLPILASKVGKVSPEFTVDKVDEGLQADVVLVFLG